MQLKNFKLFLKDIISEANRLQRFNIAGQKITDNRFTDSQIISALIAIAGVLIIKTGFSNDFAGYVISFLGIFIGLFASVMLLLYDKKDRLIENYINKDKEDKARIKKIRNFLLQFTVLVSYSIIIGLVIIVLLLLVLLSTRTQISVYKYVLVTNYEEIGWHEMKLFLQQSFNVTHRFLVIYLLTRFFFITTYTISGFFSFLFDEYRRIKLSDYTDTNTNFQKDEQEHEESKIERDWF